MERIVRTSQRPCFVACRKYTPIKKIALAYDDSPSARRALQFLLRIQFFKDIEIDIINVCEDEIVTPELQQSINFVAENLKNAGYHVKTSIMEDEVSDGIANYVTMNDIDLLVMGAYGHSPIRHLLIGSTTADLLKRCKISVLLFR